MRAIILSAFLACGLAGAAQAAPIQSGGALPADPLVQHAQYGDWRYNGRPIPGPGGGYYAGPRYRGGPPAYGRRYGGPPPHARAYGRRYQDRGYYRYGGPRYDPGYERRMWGRTF